jgi:HD-GYP domain-containing protein (c-di-GMP phosphodiesterase class II)
VPVPGADGGALLLERDAEAAFEPSELVSAERVARIVGLAFEHEHLPADHVRDLKANIEAVAQAADARGSYTVPKSREVELAVALGAELGLDARELAELELAARVHGVGMTAVPSAIITKPGPLDAEERAVVDQHPARGADLIAHVPGLEAVATIVLHHHERWDGSGYPDGVAGARIPVASRVLGACEAYRALTSHRPYRGAMDPDAALAEIESGAGSRYDPAVAAALRTALAAA